MSLRRLKRSPHRVGWSPIATARSIRICVFATLPLLFSAGCTSLWRGGAEDDSSDENLTNLLTVPKAPELVREAAVAAGLNPIRVDGVAMVNGLIGTGGPPEPSPLRDRLLEEMKVHDVASPNHLLESSETALVEVRGLIPPGARRGDPFDLYVVAPPRSHVADLHNGWLLDTRMRHQQLIQNSVRQSEVMAIATGPVLTRADFEPGTDPNLRTSGRIISGGRVTESRELGLRLRADYRHVKISSAIAAAINRRFYFFDGTTRRGIAEATEDDYIKIDIHPRYRGNEYRMMEIIRAIGVKPESSETQERLTSLAALLADPTTARDAAMQLEGMGESAVPILLDGLKTGNPELRFYTAEALAYLDREESIDPLTNAIVDVAAFRAPALKALQSTKHRKATDALTGLMNVASLETRYGAFCAIRQRSDAAETLSGETIRKRFRLYSVINDSPPAIAVSLRQTPEIVVFGQPETLKVRGHLLGTGGVMISVHPNNESNLKLSRISPGSGTQETIVAATAADVIRGIGAIGGGYGDAIEMLRQLKENDCMTTQLAINPLPASLRTYYREDQEDTDSLMRASDES